MPLALANADWNLSLAVVSGGSVGEEIDMALVEADAIARRYPYQSRPLAREAVNDIGIVFADHHIFTLGDHVGFAKSAGADVALIKAAAVSRDWLVLSTSLGHTPAKINYADELSVEVNRLQPPELKAFYDVYRPG